jgi:hypothetical protein
MFGIQFDETGFIISNPKRFCFIMRLAAGAPTKTENQHHTRWCHGAN